MTIKDIYHHKWFPRLFYCKPDGGLESGVTGYFLIEWKAFLSVGILHFKKGSREAFHSHAFNAITFWLKGSVTEVKHRANTELCFKAGFKPKYTSRNNVHKVISHEDTYALTIRGPWLDYWYEFKEGKYAILTHGRKDLVVQAGEEMTVGELRSWLALKSVDLPVNVMVETEDCQYEYPLNDMAEVKSLSGAQRIVLMHERPGIPERNEGK